MVTQEQDFRRFYFTVSSIYLIMAINSLPFRYFWVSLLRARDYIETMIMYPKSENRWQINDASQQIYDKKILLGYESIFRSIFKLVNYYFLTCMPLVILIWISLIFIVFTKLFLFPPHHLQLCLLDLTHIWQASVFIPTWLGV